MHEPFDPACSHCGYFVYCFSADSPLTDWGYCGLARENTPPSPQKLFQLEHLARNGDYPKLYSLAQGFYQETDDGCAAYKPR